MFKCWPCQVKQAGFSTKVFGPSDDLSLWPCCDTRLDAIPCLFSIMGKRTREAKAKAAAEAESGSAPAAPFLALQDKDEGLDAIFAKTFAVSLLLCLLLIWLMSSFSL